MTNEDGHRENILSRLVEKTMVLFFYPVHCPTNNFFKSRGDSLHRFCAYLVVRCVDKFPLASDGKLAFSSTRMVL